MRLLLLEVKVYQGIDDELVDDISDGGTAQGLAESLQNLSAGRVDVWIVDDGESGACCVAGDQREVGRQMTVVISGDDGAGASIDESLEEGVAPAHDVVAGVLMKRGANKDSLKMPSETPRATAAPKRLPKAVLFVP